MMIMENIYHDYSYSISQYLGKMVGSTGHPFSSIIGNVDLESLAIATQFLNKFNNKNVFSSFCRISSFPLSLSSHLAKMPSSAIGNFSICKRQQ